MRQQKNKADQIAKQKADAAKPKNINVSYYSTPLTVKIAPAPLTLQASPLATPMTPGQKQELSVNLNRLYGFADQVALSLVAGDAIGVKAADVNVPKDQPAGKLTLEVGPKAKPGEYQLIVRQGELQRSDTTSGTTRDRGNRCTSGNAEIAQGRWAVRRAASHAARLC